MASGGPERGPGPTAFPTLIGPWLDPDPGDESTSPPSPASAGTPAPLAAPAPTPDLTRSPTYAARAAAALVTHGSRARPRIAITVDDGHGREAVEAILAVFLRERVNATWFPVGSAALLHADLWRVIAGLGFEVGNHTWSHPDLTRLTDGGMRWEITRGRSAIREATGRPVAPFLRPPFGASNAAVLAAGGQTGMAAVVNWDVTSGDTGRGSVDQVVRNATRGQNGSILLFHANDRATDLRTAEALRLVIASYRDRGYELVTLGQLLRVAGPVPFPAA